MSRLHVGYCESLTQSVLDKLNVQAIRTTVDYVSRDAEEIAETTGIPYKDAVTIRKVILAQNACLSVTGKDLYKRLVESTTIMSTGIKGLDDLLDGGLYTGEVLEVCGGIATGKTQICLNVCATTLLKPNQTVVFIDTGSGFSGKRIVQMLQAAGTEAETLLSRVHIFDAFDMYEVFGILATVREEIQQKRDPFYSQLKLVILDNVASVVYPFFGGGSFADNQGLLSLLGQQLKTFAVEHSIAVMVTNNTVQAEGRTLAALGAAWRRLPHVRLMVQGDGTEHGDRRTVVVTKNCRGETGKSTFVYMKDDSPVR